MTDTGRDRHQTTAAAPDLLGPHGPGPPGAAPWQMTQTPRIDGEIQESDR